MTAFARTPNSLRLTIAIFGRTNAGKSTLLNRIAGQNVAITSPVPGTTTDAVEKAMELRPVGPVLLIDTAGLDDPTRLGAERTAAARKIFDRADLVLLAVAPGEWDKAELEVVAAATERGIRVVPVLGRPDLGDVSEEFADAIRKATGMPLIAAGNSRDALLEKLVPAILDAEPEDFVTPPPLLGDLIQPGDTVMMIVPIDKQAPKGRLIMPQMHAIRDALDHGAVPVVCRDTEYAAALAALKSPPALAVCDSQVVDLMAKLTPAGVPCTTFSILFSRLKGDLDGFAAGSAAIRNLKPGDKILIAEGCTHHASEDDIGRVKIPKLLAKMAGGELDVTVCAGRDYPENLAEFKLVVHCGGCMMNRRETLRRQALAELAGVPTTNYGMAISECRGVLGRVMEPFSPKK